MTLLPATHFDVRDVISFSIAVRIVFAVLTKRVMAFGRRWAKPSREDDGKMANMNVFLYNQSLKFINMSFLNQLFPSSLSKSNGMAVIVFLKLLLRTVGSG